MQKSLLKSGMLALATLLQSASGADTPTGDPSCMNAAAGAGSITAFYDPTSEKVIMSAVLNTGSFAGWGWGGSMTNTEMVIFSGGGTASFVYGEGNQPPSDDTALAACYT